MIRYHHAGGTQRHRVLFGLVLLPAMLFGQKERMGLGMDLPDTMSLPTITVEPWHGLPKGVRLPKHVDLSRWMPPAGDQGQQGACVTWALCYGLMSYRQNRWQDRTYEFGDPADSAHTFSPAYLYNVTKQFEMRPDERDTSLCQDGTDIDKMLELAMVGGCCSLKEMPYDTAMGSCTVRPHYTTMRSATRNFVPPAVILGTQDPVQWRYHLARQQPILVGIIPDLALVDSGYATGGERMFTWRFDPDSPDLNGGHAIVCTGYEDDSTFTFMNSWGSDWGYHGYFKATLFQLVQKCTFAYVMTNDSTMLLPLVPGTPADTGTRTGAQVRDRFAPGEFQEVNDKKVQLMSFSARERTAVVQLFDATTDTLVRNVTVLLDRPYLIYHNGERMELTVGRPSFFGTLLRRPVPFTLSTVPAKDDPYLRERNTRIARLQEDLAD